MRYDEFCDFWQAALRDARVISCGDTPEEAIDLAATTRTWKAHLLPEPVEPFHAGATIGFRWNPFEAARSYTCEEDLLRELFGREPRRVTLPRTLRMDIVLRAALPYGSTAPLPAPEVWLPWVASTEARLDGTLTAKRMGKDGAILAWRGDLEIAGGTSPEGWFGLHDMSLPAFEMLTIPRIWNDPQRRDREAAAGARIGRLASRFRDALDAWTASIRELSGWFRRESVPRGPASRRERVGRFHDGDDGPEWLH